MRICDVVLNSIWCDPRVRKQIVSYLQNNFEVSCVGLKCTRYDAEKVSQIPCKVSLAEYNPKYAGKQRGFLRYYKYFRKFQILNRDICNLIIEQKPDVIHANDLDALFPAYKAAKKLNCKLIYDSHEINTQNAYYRDKKLYCIYLSLKEKYLVKRINRMVCVSNAAADYFEKELKIEKPLVVTNCSLKAEQYISTEKNSGFEIINHGQFYEGRGYDVMLEASSLLKEYPEIKLAIRGYGVMEEQLRERAEELKADNFIFYPPVTVDKLIESASHSAVGVAITEAICLNFKLSVSNKLFEYASAGLPVIMSDIPEHRYLNNKYKFGIVLENDTPQAFADAVLKLYTDKEFYNSCAENAKKLSDEINWENEFGKLINEERNMLENNC